MQVILRANETRNSWYIPSVTEVAELRGHQSDERKGRLARRFGHPSLHKDLMTPMVEKKIEHLLGQVYHGRLGAETPMMVDSKGSTGVAAGGLTFAAIEAVRCIPYFIRFFRI